MMIDELITIIEYFLIQLIANDNPDIKPEMLKCVSRVQETGNIMIKSAQDFTLDPCGKGKRDNMVIR